MTHFTFNCPDADWHISNIFCSVLELIYVFYPPLFSTMCVICACILIQVAYKSIIVFISINTLCQCRKWTALRNGTSSCSYTCSIVTHSSPFPSTMWFQIVIIASNIPITWNAPILSRCYLLPLTPLCARLVLTRTCSLHNECALRIHTRLYKCKCNMLICWTLQQLLVILMRLHMKAIASSLILE